MNTRPANPRKPQIKALDPELSNSLVLTPAADLDLAFDRHFHPRRRQNHQVVDYGLGTRATH